MKYSKERLKIDLIVVGNQNCGKTSLIKRFVKGQDGFSHFYTPTVGLNLDKKIVSVGDRQVTACIWDTAGQEKFFSLTKNYFNSADGVLVIFDLTDRISFDRISQYWMEQVRDKSDERSVRILIGNKVDVLEAKQLAEKYGMEYFETSAKTGQQVQTSFMHLIKECASNVKQEQAPGHVIIEKEEVRQNGCFQGVKATWNRIRRSISN